MWVRLRMVIAAIGLLLHPADQHPVRGERAVDAAIERTIALDCKVIVDSDGNRREGALGSCLIDAAALKVSAWEEGQFCLGTECARGDNGRSSSTFQTMGATPEETDLYERDLFAAARRAYSVIRIGASQCPAHPLAPYCGGCRSPAAVRIGDRRLSRAWATLATATED